MRWNILSIIAGIVITIVSIFLSVFFGEIFLFPIFCVFPSFCGARNANPQGNEQEGSIFDSKQKEKNIDRENMSENNKIYDSCPKCGKLIKHPNLNYCPKCGAKLQKRY